MAPVAFIIDASKASASSRPAVAEFVTDWRMAAYARVGPAASLAASAATSPGNSSSATTLMASPSSSASAAEIVRGK